MQQYALHASVHVPAALYAPARAVLHVHLVVDADEVRKHGAQCPQTGGSNGAAVAGGGCRCVLVVVAVVVKHNACAHDMRAHDMPQMHMYCTCAWTTGRCDDWLCWERLFCGGGCHARR